MQELTLIKEQVRRVEDHCNQRKAHIAAKIAGINIRLAELENEVDDENADDTNTCTIWGYIGAFLLVFALCLRVQNA